MQRITDEAFKIEIRGIIKSLRRYRPLKVILFGSFARGDFHAGSDIDLLIVKETAVPFIERPAEVLRLCQYTLPLEPLVYTPGELERMCREENPFILLKKCIEYDAEFEPLSDSCRKLDQYYITTRYPNGLPGGVPHEMFGRGQADSAIAGALTILERVGAAMLPPT